MAGNFAGLRDGDRLGEEEPARVAIVADAFGNAGQPHEQSGIEGVLQKNGSVKMFAAEQSGEFAFGSQALLGGIGNDAVDGAFASVEIGHPGPGDECDMGVRKDSADGANGRQGHHRVAQPVGGAHAHPGNG